MAAVDGSAACHVDNSHNYATHRSVFGMKLHRDAHQIQINFFSNALIQMNRNKKNVSPSILLIFNFFLFQNEYFSHCELNSFIVSVRICLGLTWWNSIGLFIHFVIYLHLDSSDKWLLIALGVRLWHHKSVKSVLVHTQPHLRRD